MLKILAPLILLLGPIQPAAAATFDVTTERAGRDGAFMRINFGVKSNADRLAHSIFVDCTAFDSSQAPVNTGTGVIKNIQPGEKAFGTVNMRFETDMKSASCRFSHASY
ncbi:hypothetical protein [Methylorubrum extorquens]|uniref:hypothetical protein n=1 Tax=Methylorubrum extorquens TaxID=408 RepID=UPI0012DB7761|nr:hypothetical protein [Methylorubrum extorquens]